MGRVLAATLLLVLALPGVAAAVPAPSPPPSPEPSSGAFLLSFDGAPPAAGALLAPGARVLESFPFARVALVAAPASARASLAALPGVEGVYDEEPIALTMERERTLVDADAPAGAQGWPTGASVTVALVDSGIDASHPAFAGRVSASVRISRGGVVSADAGDADGHGTHVAGIVAGDGTGSPNARHRGLAPDARLVGLDISDSFTTTNAVRAFAWISENADKYDIKVVSNSWGREKDDAHYDAEDPVIRASDALVAQGIVVVFSAGNRGREGGATLTTEAMNPNVIAVGAAGGSGRPESYSSRGPAVDGRGQKLSWTKPDVVAPGTAVVSARASVLVTDSPRTDEERYYTVMNGTSMAAPQVAGAAALLLDAHPELTPADVQVLLQRTAVDLGASGADDDTGYGMLDVAAALAEASYVSAGERRIVIESRVPVRKEGSLGAAAGQILLEGSAPRLPPAASASLPLELPQGAVGVDLWFNWSGQGSFDARLVGPDGPLAFARTGAQSLHLAAPAAPGSYHVEVIASSPAAYSPYTLAGGIAVREERLIEVASESHGVHARPAGGGFAASADGMAPLEIVARAPWLVLALAGTMTVSLALRLRRRA
ncbi:MAG TPA: S8 family serine peptidase [Candidatus Thermoplasmatota archaeon]|nr:S8 family serine peptidase [Candidatus Thermoplasmatota archaeon]